MEMANISKKLLTILSVFNIIFLGNVFPVFAEELSNYELTQRLKNLEKQAGISGISNRWTDRIALSGLLEAEAGYESMDYNDPALEDEDGSDAVLATMEFGVDAVINEYVSGHALFLWEEDDTEPIDLDEGFITLTGGQGSPGYLTAGKMYVPFGNFASNMVSDPLTLELGETRESAIQAGIEMNGFYGSAYLFNGDMDEAGEDSHLNNFGGSAGFTMENNNFSLDAGVSYINNILDSDGLGDFVSEEMEEGGNGLDEHAAGLGAHAIATFDPVMFIAEYITVLDEPEFVSDTAGVGFTGEEIAAWNAELGYFFEIAGKPANAGLACQGTDRAGDFLPETRMMGTIGCEIFDATYLALEYFHDAYENDDEADVITAQLAIEF